MSKTDLLAPLLLSALLVPGAARAGVVGSPHDLVAQGYDVEKEGDLRRDCSSCHPLQSPDEWNLLNRVPPSLEGYSSSDLTCFSCHDGTTIISPHVDASMTAFHPRSHGYDVPEEALQDLQESGLPVTREGRLGCKTCHDPHSDYVRPFLHDGFEALCLACHANLAGEGGEVPAMAGNHPLAPVDGADKDSLPRVVIDVAEAFRVAFPLSYPLENGKRRPGVHWQLGGHLEDGAAGRVVCVTCHNVHGREEEPPRAKLLSSDPVNRVANLFCEGCHRGARGDGTKSPFAPNPGGTATARTYHPCDDDRGNGAGRIVPITEPAGWAFGLAPERPLLCTSCHRPHGAWEDSSLLRHPVEGKGFCESCHADVPLEHHHPVTGLEGGSCYADMPADPERKRKGSLMCDGCHRAHNAGLGGEEGRFVPILRFALQDDASCESCHPADNPTCGDDPLYIASHFLGDPSLPETYDKTDSLMRSDPWPESGIPSLYGGTEGRKEIICLTCHTFKPGAVTSGDDGTAGHLVAKAGNLVEWDSEGESSLTAYLCTGCHSAAPGTTGGGKTHPLMEADGSKLLEEPHLRTTLTPSGHVNCDSCHRSHGARSASGYYILEVVDGPNEDPKTIHPEIDFAKLCHQCHSPEKY